MDFKSEFDISHKSLVCQFMDLKTKWFKVENRCKIPASHCRGQHSKFSSASTKESMFGPQVILIYELDIGNRV